VDPLELIPEGQVVAQGQHLRLGIANVRRGEVLAASASKGI
jgi:hypothetical protein